MSLSDMVTGTVAGELHSILVGRFVGVNVPALRHPVYPSIPAGFMARVIEHVDDRPDVVRVVTGRGDVLEARVLPRTAVASDFDQVSDPPYVTAVFGDITDRYFEEPAFPWPYVEMPPVPTGPPNQAGQVVRVQYAEAAPGRRPYAPYAVVLALTVGAKEAVVFVPATQQIVMALDDSSATTFPRIVERTGIYWPNVVSGNPEKLPVMPGYWEGD